jgi:hypothetical protein
MIVVCREINRETGEITAYKIDVNITDALLFKLGIRSRVNPELKYFVTRLDESMDISEVLKMVKKKSTRLLIEPMFIQV